MVHIFLRVSMTDSSFSRRSERETMVRDQIAARAVRDTGVLGATRTVPREAFVAPETVDFAHEDTPLPIGADQTISQPYVVASMIEALRPQPHHRVLEVGADSDPAAAVLSRVYVVRVSPSNLACLPFGPPQAPGWTVLRRRGIIEVPTAYALTTLWSRPSAWSAGDTVSHPSPLWPFSGA